MKIPVILLFMVFPTSIWTGRIHNEYCSQYLHKIHLLRFARSACFVNDPNAPLAIVDFFPMKKQVDADHCTRKNGDSGYFYTYDVQRLLEDPALDVCFR